MFILAAESGCANGRATCLKSKWLRVRISLSAQGNVAQSAEASDLSPDQCEFESRRFHHALEFHSEGRVKG